MPTPQLSLAGGVYGFSPGVALPGGFGQGMPPSVSPIPGIPLSPVDSDCSRVNSLLTTVPSYDLPPTCSFHHSDICHLLPEDFGELRDIWKLCLIGYTIGRTPGYTILGKFMANAWKCNATLYIHDSGWLIFRFSSATDMGRVLRREPYSFQGKPLVLKPMPPYFDFGKPNMSSVLVWVRLPNLPLECWSPACLSKISSVIGKHIRCDDLTLSMSRVSFARVMVEVHLIDDLPHSISLSMPDGTIINQKVIYEYKPRFCSFCCITGHTSNVCRKLNPGAEGSPASGKLKRASDLRSPAEDIGQDTGDYGLQPVELASGSREALQEVKSKLSPSPDVSTQHASNAIGPCDSAAAVPVVLNRENSENSDTPRREHPHQLAPSNVITLSDDSSGSDTTAKGNSESSPIAKFTYITRSKALPFVLGPGTPTGKRRKKSRMTAVVADAACD